MNAIHSSTAELLRLDEDNRREAIDTTRSFIIEAPAGAGKTELLTQRYLALLLTVNDPEEIIALTFTNKAVAEMRKRIVDSLAKAEAGNRPPEAHKQITFDLSQRVLAHAASKKWDILEHSGRLQITTLDALCGRLVRQMPLLSRFGAQPGIAIDSSQLYQQAVNDTLGLLEQEGAVGETVGRVLAYFDNDHARLGQMLASMLANRDQWLRHTRPGALFETAESALNLLISDELEAVATVLPPEIQTQIMPAARYAAASVRLSQTVGELDPKVAAVALLENWDRPLSPSYEDLPRWRALTVMLLTEKGTVRSLLPGGMGFSEPAGKAYAKALKDCLAELKDRHAETLLFRIRSLPSPLYGEDERQLVEDLYCLLKLASANLWLVFQANRQVDFAQMAQNALEALGQENEPTDLQLQLDYRISHLLVDEFQDTSPTQVELLKKLMAGWQSGDGRTLFLVGDPMQSIYRFRKADVGLFLKVRDKGIGNINLTALSLYRNNRSTKALVEWVNSTFADVFPAEDELKKGAVKFSPAAYTKETDHPTGVHIHPIINCSGKAKEEDAESSAARIEARKIIELIQKAVNDDSKGTIAVLVRARSHLNELVNELKFHEPKIHYQAVEIEPLAHRQPIQDLLSLTRALFHLADRVNWLSILRAPWCGLTLADLHALAADAPKAPIWLLLQDESRISALSSDGQQRAKQIRSVFADAFGNQGRQRPRRWVEGIWQSIGGPLCLRDEGEYLDVVSFFDVLDQLETRGTLDLDRLESELEKLFAAPDPLAPSTIQLMTIHKSKGLEFDTVILPGLHHAPRNSDKQLIVWDEILGEDGEEHLLMAPVSLSDTANDYPSKSAFLYQFEQERAGNEMQRLLYVAVTRAKRELHLLGVAKQDKEDVKAPPKGTCLFLLWKAVVNAFKEAATSHAPEVEMNAASEMNSPFQPKLIRLANPVCPIPIQKIDPPDKISAKEASCLTDHPADAPALADFGTLVHRYLEFIAKEGLERWPITRVEQAQPRMYSWFMGRGYSVGQAEELSNEALQHLKCTLASEDGKWILRHRDDAGCEVVFSHVSGEGAKMNVVDRTFVENNIRWIVDYKTTRIPADVAPNELLAIAQGYSHQLDRYEALFASASLPVKRGIFFTETGRFQQV